jgi:hypothetical protein
VVDGVGGVEVQKIGRVSPETLLLQSIEREGCIWSVLSRRRRDSFCPNPVPDV